MVSAPSIASGATVPNVATNFAGKAVTLPALPVTAVEYYHAGLDHYFISSLQQEIDTLDTGRIAGWARTGQSFRVFPSQASGGASVNPVCRFYIPPVHGNSHFFSASPAECNLVVQKTATDPNFSGYVFESPNVFYATLPDTTTGACPAGTAPVYRLWNQRIDSNHRYTASAAIKAQMIATGYVAEGYGPDAVIMCAASAGTGQGRVRRRHQRAQRRARQRRRKHASRPPSRVSSPPPTASTSARVPGPERSLPSAATGLRRSSRRCGRPRSATRSSACRSPMPSPRPSPSGSWPGRLRRRSRRR